VKPGRLKTALVYFGLVEDPVEDARLRARQTEDGPLNAWQKLAVVVLCALVLGGAFTAVALITGRIDVGTFLATAAVVLFPFEVSAWRERRRKRRER
jgi:hypothetical protein